MYSWGRGHTSIARAIFFSIQTLVACITPASLGRFCRSPKICFAENHLLLKKRADKQLRYMPRPVQCRTSVLQSRKAAAQRSATKWNKLRAFLKLVFSSENFRWQNCYEAKANWGPKRRDPQRGREPKEGWFTSQHRCRRGKEQLIANTKVPWEGRSEEAHPTAAHSVPLKDLAMQNVPSLRQLSLSNYNRHFSSSLPPCLEQEILQHFSKKNNSLLTKQDIKVGKNWRVYSLLRPKIWSLHQRLWKEQPRWSLRGEKPCRQIAVTQNRANAAQHWAWGRSAAPLPAFRGVSNHVPHAPRLCSRLAAHTHVQFIRKPR